MPKVMPLATTGLLVPIDTLQYERSESLASHICNKQDFEKFWRRDLPPDLRLRQSETSLGAR